MLRFDRLLPVAPTPPATTLTLPFAARQRSRQRVRLDDGREAALMLPRGTVLRDGDLLAGEQAPPVQVRAAAETISTARAASPVLLARGAYHLGNRHVALQVGEGWLRYGHDHVLDEMLVGLGLAVICEQAPFEPEAGAYGAGQHAHHAHHATDADGG